MFIHVHTLPKEKIPNSSKKKLVRLKKRAIAIMNPGAHDVASEVLNMRLIEEHHNDIISYAVDYLTA